MDKTRSPKDVALALVDADANGRWEELTDLYAERTHVVLPLLPSRRPAFTTRDELRELFGASGSGPRPQRRAANVTIHETADPEVVIAEFEYQGTVGATGEPYTLPGIFVLRVRDGEIVSSRDYFDHATAARIKGQLDTFIAAVKTGGAGSAR